MKTRTLGTALAVISLFMTQSALGESGDDILRQVEQRDQGKDFQATMTMQIMRGGDNRERSFHWWARHEGGADSSLIKYLTPKDMKDSGLLIKSEAADDTQHWVFLSQAAKKEARRVAEQDKDKPFLGSDFFYVDFERLRARNFSAKLLSKGDWKTYKVAVLELTPKKPSFAYAKIVTKIDLASFVPVYSELVQKDGSIRLYEVEKLNKINGLWTIQSSLMSSNDGSSKTRLIIESISYNKGIDSSFFSIENLTRSI